MAPRFPFLFDSRGSAAAEMALVLPLLLALIFTMLEGANYAWNEHKVVMGVRDAARYAGRQDFSKYTCPSTIDSTTATAIKNMARTGQISGGNSRVSGWVDANITLTLSCTAGTGGLYSVVGGNAPKVKVAAKVAYPSLLGTLGLGSASLSLGAAAESPVMGL